MAFDVQRRRLKCFAAARSRQGEPFLFWAAAGTAYESGYHITRNRASGRVAALVRACMLAVGVLAGLPRASGQVAGPGGADPVPNGSAQLIVTREQGGSGAYRLAISGDPATSGPTGTFYRTSREIRNARVIEVDPPAGRVIPPGSNARTQLALWNELGTDGKLWPHRAIRNAGSRESLPSEDSTPLGNWDDHNRDGVSDLGFVCIGHADYRLMLRYAEFNPVGLTAWSGPGAPPGGATPTPSIPEAEPWAFGQPLISDGLSASDVAAYDVDEDGDVDPTGYAGGGCHVFIVQFWTQALQEYRRGLHNAGAVILHYIPQNGYAVSLPNSQIADAVARLPFVRCIVPYHPAYRVDHNLADRYFGRNGTPPTHPEGNDTPLRYNVQVFARGPDQKLVLARRIAAFGGRIEDIDPSGFLLSATLTIPQLRELLRRDEVHYVDLCTGVSDDTDIARSVSGAVALETLGSPFLYTGRGVRGEVMDAKINSAHIAFAGFLRHGDQSDEPLNVAPRHATSTFGIAFGDGKVLGGAVDASRRGFLFGAGRDGDTLGQGVFASYWRLSNLIGGGNVSRYTHTEELVNAALPYKAVFQSNSWGNCETLSYDTYSAQTDDILLLHDLVLCQSQGNGGGGSTPPCRNPGELLGACFDPAGRCSRAQAWSKNVVSVGGIWHNDSATPTDDAWMDVNSGYYYDLNEDLADAFCPNVCPSPPEERCRRLQLGVAASVGPAADGRIKPDLHFFFDMMRTTTWDPDCSPAAVLNSLYREGFCCTSAATPAVAGCFGILHQMWHQQEFAGFGGAATVFQSRPKAATAKALMINTAWQYSFASTTEDLTRTHQGWGRPNLKAAPGDPQRGLYDLRYNMFIVNETDILSKVGQTAIYSVNVTGELPLKVTLVYTDPAGSPGATVHRVNDLSLFVVSPTGTGYWGNRGLLSSPWSVAGGAPDAINTVENVFIQNPQTGAWTIEVQVYDLNGDSHIETPPSNDEDFDVDFALVASGVSPAASHLPPDWNGDGRIDGLDVMEFLNSYLKGDADWDRDGTTSPVDLYEFLTHFLGSRSDE